MVQAFSELMDVPNLFTMRCLSRDRPLPWQPSLRSKRILQQLRFILWRSLRELFSQPNLQSHPKCVREPDRGVLQAHQRVDGGRLRQLSGLLRRGGRVPRVLGQWRHLLRLFYQLWNLERLVPEF